jgi:hypothetical protein
MKKITQVTKTPTGKAILATATLILVGSTLTSEGIQVHVPVAKNKPDMSFINSKYMINNRYSGDLSEMRKKEILTNIRSIRTQIRERAQGAVNDQQMAENLILACASNLAENSRQREYILRAEAAKKYNTRPKYINYEKVKEQQHIVTLSM